MDKKQGRTNNARRELTWFFANKITPKDVLRSGKNVRLSKVRVSGGGLYLCVQFEGKVVLLLLKGRVPFRPLQATVLKPHRLVILIKRIRHSGEKGEDKLFFSKQLTSAFFKAILCHMSSLMARTNQNYRFFTSPLHLMLYMYNCNIPLFEKSYHNTNLLFNFYKCHKC